MRNKIIIKKHIILFLSKYRLTSYFLYLLKYIYTSLFCKEQLQYKTVAELPHSDEYYVYFSYHAQECSFILPHLYSHNKPSYLWIYRNKHIYEENLPNHVKYMTSGTARSLFSGMMTLKRLLLNYKKIIISNPNVKLYIFSESFNIYYLVKKLNIPNSNYTVISADTGNYSKNEIRFLMADKKNFEDELEYVKNLVDNIFRFWEPFKVYAEVPVAYIMLILSTVLDKYEIWCPFAEYIKKYPISSEFPENLITIKDSFNIKDISPLDIVKSLPEGDKKQLLLLLGIDNGKFDTLFLNTDKPCLIIIGKGLKILSGDIFKKNIKEVYEKYAGKYNLLYKHHPGVYSDPLNTKQMKINAEQVLSKYGIQLLEYDNPIELLLLFYPEVYIGGYLSTTFASVKTDRIKFIFYDINDLTEGTSMSFYEYIEIDLKNILNKMQPTEKKMLYKRFFSYLAEYTNIEFIS